MQGVTTLISIVPFGPHFFFHPAVFALHHHPFCVADHGPIGLVIDLIPEFVSDASQAPVPDEREMHTNEIMIKVCLSPTKHHRCEANG